MDKRAINTRGPVEVWLGVGVIMVMVQILLGGVTRLTGSGLSITEWQPLMGALPPLTHTEWLRSFHLYQQIAQFKKLNNDFTLANYQGLFFWEWLHREWARLMGLVFIIPFIVFRWQRKFNDRQCWQLVGLFLLGALQGLAGWIMVQSGLNDTDVVVNHLRLAVHFFLALLLLVYLFWMYLCQQEYQNRIFTAIPARGLSGLIIFILAIQLIYGAFMAGTHAELYAPTWPDINGAFLVSSANITGSFWHRITYDPLLIQFIHRLLAYVLSLLFIIWFVFTRRRVPVLFIIIQVTLGVACLLNSATPLYPWLAILHQLNAILLLLSMVGIYYKSHAQGSCS